MEASHESALFELHAGGDYQACLTRALDLYGQELHGFLRARSNDGDADEIYSVVCAALVEALPRFERRASFRTWMYQIARFTVARALRGRAAPHLPLSQVSDPAQLIARRSEPPSHLGEAAQARLAALRAELSEADRELLYLRVDRGLDWREVAEALGEGAEPDDAVTRRSAALRKRFERLKGRIRQQLQL